MKNAYLEYKTAFVGVKVKPIHIIGFHYCDLMVMVIVGKSLKRYSVKSIKR